MVPRSRDSWLRRVPLVASWLSGTWLLRLEQGPAAAWAPDPPLMIPAGPTHPTGQSPVPLVTRKPAVAR